MNEPPKKPHPTWQFSFRCERLERALAIMRQIRTPNFSEEDLLATEVDLNKIDEEFGLVPPSIPPYFMPGDDDFNLVDMSHELTYDWFLNMKGSFGKGSNAAPYLLRRTLMDYQDRLDTDRHFLADSLTLDDDSDTGSDNESEYSYESMVLPEPDELREEDRDYIAYRSDRWTIYHHQRWNGFDLPNRQYGFGIYRSARLDSPQYHQWAMAEIFQCGDDEPSTIELIVLASWMLKSMSNKRQALADGVEQLNAFHSGANFPTMIFVFDLKCRVRILWGYYDTRLHVQFSPVMDFGEFTTNVSANSFEEYLSLVDCGKYCTMMHSLISWTWPSTEELTTQGQIPA